MAAERLRVAFFVDVFYPQISGVLTSYMNTANELARRGHEILIVAPKVAGKRRYDPTEFPYPLLYRRGIPGLFYPDFRITWPFSLTSMTRAKRFQADIIHFHAPLTIAMQGIATAKMLRIPLIGTFHTFFAETEYLKVVGLEHWRWLVNAGWWYNNLLYDACDVVISPAKWTAKDLTQHKAKARIEVIPNGIEFSKYSGLSGAQKRADLPVALPPEAEMVIFVGRVSREKSIDVLIEAMKHILQLRPQARLIVVGEGPARSELMSYADSLGLGDKVIFTGGIKNDVLLQSGLLRQAKVFATASTSENQPMTIMEAMIFGLPIVGVDARGVPEMIQGNGLVCPPGDAKAIGEAIAGLLGDEKRRLSMSAASQHLAQDYDIERTTDRLEALYWHEIEAKRRQLRLG